MILEISFTIFLILLVLVFSFWGKIKRKYRQRFLFTPIERQLVQLYNLNQYSEFVDHFNKFNIKANISDYVFFIKPFFVLLIFIRMARLY